MNLSRILKMIFAALALAFPALAADGNLDTNFSPMLSPAANQSIVIISQTVVQADGKILVAGSFSAVGDAPRVSIARLNADGSLDTTFNAGTGASDSNIDSLAIQPDGKILVGGAFTAFNGVARQRVARLNADGTVDTTFIPAQSAATNRVNAIAIQPDGKVLIGVALSTIKRLNADGTLDNSFNTTMVPQVGVIEIKLQADGKILIGGGWDFLNNAEYRFGLARLNADGSTDNSFVPHENKFNIYGAAVAELIPQADGKIVAVGNLRINSATNNKHIVRFNADGTIDNTFNSGADAGNTIFSVLRQPNGKYIIAGSFTAYNGATANRVARLNADGSLDNSFNTTVNNNTIYAAARLTNGKILIGGYFTQVDTMTRPGLALLQNAVPNKTAICDYDGDGRSDFALRRVVSGLFQWYIAPSGGGSPIYLQWGRGGDRILCGDYDGDQKTDIAVWRANATTAVNGTFYILNSSDNSTRIEVLGLNGDTPLIGDFDGDGKTDLAVYRGGASAGAQSYFYYRGSSNNPNGDITYVPWGTSGDRPYVGDFDGDGKTDFAVQRAVNNSGVHFILQSSNNSYRIAYYGNGSINDTIVPGDYNGDGKTDIALRRTENGNQYWYITTDFGTSYYSIPFGITSAQTAVGDYDGDGKSDIAVFQNDTSGGGFNFFVQQSSNGNIMNYRWGQNLDSPVATFNQF